MSAIERAYLAGFARAAREIRWGYKVPIVLFGIHETDCNPTPGFRKGYFAGWEVAK